MAVTITLTDVQVSTLTMDEAKAHFASALPATAGKSPALTASRSPSEVSSCRVLEGLRPLSSGCATGVTAGVGLQHVAHSRIAVARRVTSCLIVGPPAGRKSRRDCSKA